MWSCARKRKRLGAYIDGELNDRETEAIGAHITNCVVCRVAVEDLRRLTPALHALEAPPVPPGLANHVMALARTRTARPKNLVTWSPLEWWQMVSAPLRLAVCATVLLAFFLGLTIGRGAFLSGNNLASAAGAGMEGFEWFSQTPPASLGSTYLMLASNDMGGWNQ